jgi:hypothetical protein
MNSMLSSILFIYSGLKGNVGGSGFNGQHYFNGGVDPHQTFRMFFVRNRLFCRAITHDRY